MDHSQMSASELQLALAEVNAEIDRLKELARKLRQLRDTKLAQESAIAKFEALSPDEKAALSQHIQVHGIGPAPEPNE